VGFAQQRLFQLGSEGMTPRHRVSRTAIDMIERFEGYRRKAAQLPDGRWTIGYGHTQTARQGAEVSQADAEALLIYDLIGVAQAINEQVFTPLTQNQFDALCAFVFNVGIDNFRTSGVLKRLNEGALVQAACAMELWRKAEFAGERIVIDALVRRRAAEKFLFLTPAGGEWVPAPSPILRPLLDLDAFDIVPRRLPAQVSASMDGETVRITRTDAHDAGSDRLEADETGPATAAAEAVTARLQTIFPEAEPRTAQAGAPACGGRPENIADEPHPQADFAPPGEEPFTLVPPSQDEEDEIVHQSVEGDASSSQELMGPDLFDERTAANDLVEDDEFELDDISGPRMVIDDAAPFDFGAVTPRPLPEQPRAGLLFLLVLPVIGLVFFAGAIFWGLNARPVEGSLDPRIVAWLAGLAGVVLLAVSAFLLLQRLGQASERAARTRRR
jgi:lysozyme